MLLNLSCNSLIKGQGQPVNLIDSQNHIYMTACSGLAETIGTCYDKAKTTCNGKYEIIKEFRDSSGVHRELTFQCKK
jgi:hypothetical protein